MSDTKFTPGPWRVEPSPASHEGWFEDANVVRSDGLAVSVGLHNGPIGPKEALANAHLIASAPDLYEALAIFLGEDDRFQVTVGGNPIAVEAMLVKAHAALAKARGEGQ